MLEKEVETEEEIVTMGRAGTESEVRKRGWAVGTERGTGEELVTGIMTIEIEIMGEIGTGVDIVIKISSRSAFWCID